MSDETKTTSKPLTAEEFLSEHAGGRRDFTRANLRILRLNNFVLNDIILNDADLTEASLWQSELNKSKLINAKLNKAILTTTSLINADLTGAELRDASLFGAKLLDARLVGAKLNNANLSGADLSRANLRKADLTGAKLVGTVLAGANLTEAILTNATISSANLMGATLNGAIIIGAEIISSDFNSAHCTKANFSGAKLTNSTLNHANLTEANLTEADLSGSKFVGATLTSASLSKIKTDKQTSFESAKAEGCYIEKYTLEGFYDHGGLSPGQRMRMNVEDSVAELRSSFSGFWQWVHLVALVAFVYPYLAFLFWNSFKTVDESLQPSSLQITAQEYQQKISDALLGGCQKLDDLNLKTPCENIAGKISPQEETITLWGALCVYIRTGGKGGEGYSWVLGIFLFSLLYNFLRGALLYKTKTLEMEQQVSGLPVIFSLEHRSWLGIKWKWLYKAVNFGFYLNVALVLLHSYHFLSKKVPLEQIDW